MACVRIMGEEREPGAKIAPHWGRPSSLRGLTRTHWPGCGHGGCRAWPPQQIRQMCGDPPYRRVVIEIHRTQASRTMNAEPVPAATDRVS